MTIEQYLKSSLGELQFAMAAVLAERDVLKAERDAVKAQLAETEKSIKESAPKAAKTPPASKE